MSAQVTCPNCNQIVTVGEPGYIPCPACEQVMDVSAAHFSRPKAAQAYAPEADSTPAVQKIKKGEFLGVGCLVQGLGILLLFFFPIGTIIGIALLIAGGRMAIRWKCGNCRNRVEKDAMICPACRIQLR